VFLASLLELTDILYHLLFLEVDHRAEPGEKAVRDRGRGRFIV
jgi:hypothetical protein